MDFPYGETVTRQRATQVSDPYSGETGPSWSNPSEVDIEGCAFDPGGSSEALDLARNVITTQPTVYAPVGADITAADRLVVRGVTYEVDGDVAVWRNPFTGWEPGLVVPLKWSEG